MSKTEEEEVGTTITSVSGSAEEIFIDDADSTGTPNQQTASTLWTHSTIFCCLLLEEDCTVFFICYNFAADEVAVDWLTTYGS